MNYFEKPEDIYRRIQLSIDGVVVDTDDFTEIKIKVIDWLNNTIAKYTWTGGNITKEEPTTDGYISFIIPGTTNSNSRCGKYYYQITTTEDDEDYPDGVRTRKFIGECYGLKYAKE